MQIIKSFFSFSRQQKFSVCLDAGHGGSDSGAVNHVIGLNEKDVTLAVAIMLKSILVKQGHEVVMTRETDVYLNLAVRAEFANTAGSGVFVSMHCNSVADKSVAGIETHHYPGSIISAELANCIHDEMLEKFSSSRNRGVKASDFQVLRDTWMPACLAEWEFISNDEQAIIMADPKYQMKMAEAITEGLNQFFKKSNYF